MKDDYDLSKLEKITVRGLSFNVMPRYKYLYLDHEYERFSLDLLDRLVDEDSAMVDIGAHYGIYSLLSSKKAKHVYSFEPVPENHTILKRNIKDNGIDNITTYNMAVSDEVGKAEFNIPWASDSAGFYEHPNAETLRKISIDVTAIDKQLKAKNIGLVKIDTEGHEIHVLEGMRETLENNENIKLLIEFNPECLNNAGFEPMDLVKKIQELGFDCFGLHEDTRDIVTVGESTTAEEILKCKEYLNLLCLRKGSWVNPLFYLHSASVSGGAELCGYEMISGIVKDHKKFVLPYVVLPAEGPMYDYYLKLAVGLKIIYSEGWVNGAGLPEPGLRKKRTLNARASVELAEVVESFKPYVGCSQTIIMPWLANVTTTFGVPHVWYIHEFGDIDHGFSFDYGYKESLNFIGENSEAVVVNSNAVAKHIAAEVGKKKIDVLPLDVTPLATTKHTPKVFSGSGLKLAVAGRVMPSKGQLDAVKALKLLGDKKIDAELLIMGDVGSDEYMQQIKDYIKTNNITGKVHIIPHQKQPGDYMKQADIYLMCSKNEAFGRVTAEAMLLGIPVVGSRSGGTEDIVSDGVDGLLYKPGDIDDLASCIEQLARNKEKLKRFGLKAKENAKSKFSNKQYSDSALKIFEVAAAKKKPVDNFRRDLMSGMVSARVADRLAQKQNNDRHQQEIAHFSEKYNEVYAAYNKLSGELTDLRSKKAIKLAIGATHKVDDLKGKIKINEKHSGDNNKRNHDDKKS
jgi:FkbM family methyltransferase